MFPFDQLMPEIGFDETRTIQLREALHGVPAGEYGLREMYCVERDCDCRRVVLSVIRRGSPLSVATINHAFDPPKPDALVPEQTFLDPINPQSPYAGGLLDIFLHVVLTPDYADRLQRHYRLVKDALADPRHPIHQRVREIQREVSHLPLRPRPQPHITPDGIGGTCEVSRPPVRPRPKPPRHKWKKR